MDMVQFHQPEAEAIFLIIAAPHPVYPSGVLALQVDGLTLHTSFRRTSKRRR